MARYIDADKLIKTLFPIGLIDDGKYTINAKAVKYAIDNAVPRSEVAKEIFEEVEKVVNYALCVDITDWSAYTELKKKYTEAGNES